MDVLCHNLWHKCVTCGFNLKSFGTNKLATLASKATWEACFVGSIFYLVPLPDVIIKEFIYQYHNEERPTKPDEGDEGLGGKRDRDILQNKNLPIMDKWIGET